MVYFFQAGAPLSIENAKFWPVLAILSRIYALFSAPFTGLNSAVVPKIDKYEVCMLSHFFSSTSPPRIFSSTSSLFSFLREESIK